MDICETSIACPFFGSAWPQNKISGDILNIASTTPPVSIGDEAKFALY
jgi:hypothetical protein